MTRSRRIMQAINIAIVNPLFLVVFLGVAIACLATAVIAVTNLSLPGAGYFLAGALVYLIGSLGVTAAFNIPRNNALAALPPEAPGSAAYWHDYQTAWTRWNHVRAIVEGANGALLPVFLRCDTHVLHQRVGNPDRVERGKLQSVAGLDDVLARWHVAPVPHERCLTLDTAALPPEEAADAIMRHFGHNHGHERTICHAR